MPGGRTRAELEQRVEELEAGLDALRDQLDDLLGEPRLTEEEQEGGK